MEIFDSANAVNNAAVVPIIVAIVQLFKMVGDNGFMKKYAPFISLAAGILMAFLMNIDTMPIHEVILSGILYGLSASGLYSGTKATSHAIKGIDDDPETNGTNTNNKI
jgi:hypothetical protein